MPEGHTIHRAARKHHRKLAGQRLQISSPQGRFTASASHLSGQICVSVEALGKHLLYRFETGDVLHIHLGLFGRIRNGKLPLQDPRGAVRVRLVGEQYYVDINGPTICETMLPEDAEGLFKRIGPDVLRSDAAPLDAFNRISKSKSSIGKLIMDQSVMAGIGNIYRTEILWRQGVHPEKPGKNIDRKAFDNIWEDAKNLLAIGVKHNAIITVDRAKPSGGRYRERVNIFNQEQCPKCLANIRMIEISGRKAYVCESCQPRDFDS